jgi:trimeric autotransporter adhesin
LSWNELPFVVKEKNSGQSPHRRPHPCQSVTITSVQGNSTITTGAGADNIVAGTGIDTVTLGAGNDIVNGQAGADVIDLGTGQDTVVIESTESTGTATDVIKGFSTSSGSWTGSSANDFASEVIALDIAGAEGDVLDFETHEVGSSVLTVEADATGTANLVSSIAGISSGTVTANVANGILTVAGANAADVDTLAEWVDVAAAIAATEDEVLAFEFSGSTYVYSDNGLSIDYLVQLAGLTGVSGLWVTAASGTVGGEGYIIIA